MLKEILLDAFDLTNSKGNRIKKDEKEWDKVFEGRVRQRVQ